MTKKKEYFPKNYSHISLITLKKNRLLHSFP